MDRASKFVVQWDRQPHNRGWWGGPDLRYSVHVSYLFHSSAGHLFIPYHTSHRTEYRSVAAAFTVLSLTDGSLPTWYCRAGCFSITQTIVDGPITATYL